jgi:hypothetical protein
MIENWLTGTDGQRARRVGSDETVSLSREVDLKQIAAIKCPPIKQRGSIMVAFILNWVYRQFLGSSLPGMRTPERIAADWIISE